MLMLVCSITNVKAYKLLGHELTAKATSYKFINTTHKTAWEQGMSSWGIKNIGADSLLDVTYFDSINIWGELTKYTAYLNSYTSQLSKTNWARSTAAHEIGPQLD
ncbi:MAG: hypothetical protein RR585_07860 [Coprobacillus sp.]